MAKVTVTNVGDVAGKDVAQLYVQTPTEEMMKGLTNSTYELTGNGSAGDVTWGADNGLR